MVQPYSTFYKSLCQFCSDWFEERFIVQLLSRDKYANEVLYLSKDDDGTFDESKLSEKGEDGKFLPGSGY